MKITSTSPQTRFAFIVWEAETDITFQKHSITMSFGDRVKWQGKHKAKNT